MRFNIDSFQPCRHVVWDIKRADRFNIHGVFNIHGSSDVLLLFF